MSGQTLLGQQEAEMNSRTFIGVASTARPRKKSAAGHQLHSVAASDFRPSDTQFERERCSAFISTLRYLKAEADSAGVHLAATLIGAAIQALSTLGGSTVSVAAEDAPGGFLASEDSRVGLVRCLTLLREELDALPDPMPARFVHAAILSLGGSGPWEIAQGLQLTVPRAPGSGN
jgi:hypothetical protein